MACARRSVCTMDVTALRQGLTGPPASPSAVTARATPARAATGHGIRPEIQALRALAVSLVVAWHLWPDAVPGGFVGVDVFFAISGFLITSLLLREVEKTGRVSLRDFWARRARRILPAALTVVAACAGATALLVPVTDWSRFFSDFRASTLYIQNWHLAAQAVDYLHASDGPSPVQHFWSLAVEEQFYLVWPLVVLGVVLATRGRGERVRRGALAGALGAITLSSLVYGIAHTASHPADAYFATTTRGWELGAGALLSLLPQRERSPAAVRAALSWIGLAAILVAAFAYTNATPFPGLAAALPVLGAIAVIRAGAPGVTGAPTPLLAAWPLQRLGDLSYAVYLWHWPLIVLAPYALHHDLDTPTRLSILMLSLLLSLFSKAVIEDPVRRSRLLAQHRVRWTFAAAAAASATLLALTDVGTEHVSAQIHRDAQVTRRTLAHKPRCFGAAARDPRRTCVDAKLSRTVVPTPVQAPKMDNSPCRLVESSGRLRVCAFGAAAAPGVRTVALIGDSHASHWRSALEVVAKAEGRRGLSITHTSCPYSAGTAIIPEPARTECVQWKAQLHAWLTRHPEVDTVFFGEHATATVVAPYGRSEWEAQVRGYRNAWAALPASVAHVLVMRDNPQMRGTTLDCVQRALERHHDAGRSCAQPRGRALHRDPAAVAAAHATGSRVHTIDLARLLCDRRSCFPVIGGALVYKDIHHLTTVFSATLGPYVQRQVEALGVH
jgi:peptidoglycan/LPS O-acetylase OafA/YrhL